MKNKWKVSFLLLAAVVLLGLIYILYLLFQPVEQRLPADAAPALPPESQAEFNVTTTKEDLTIVANRFLEEELNGQIDFSVALDDLVALQGSLPVFNSQIDFLMTFDAQAMENGNLLLTQESLSLGAIDLPVSNVLKFIEDSYEFPEWVDVQPNDQEIIIQVTEIDVAAGLNVKTNQFNLRDNDISFSIYVPR
ncbi:YpmS family protein [Jeotgalibacillus sp. ET6]|uniref:YpmS family protein n=1 Tax=Jeotgalibacillus sp. ET6 TaxID=3037260 RepID=UPI002418717C|nr:YpmS family protein [Jeotgalibacillus sp. ET6]MDG5470570.1 YpmS family protein [Jeotgalibacillus sp. ET6]